MIALEGETEVTAQDGGIHPPIDADPEARGGITTGEEVGQEVLHHTGEGGIAKRAATAANQKCESVGTQLVLKSVIG